MPKADPVATATLASGGKAALASRLVAATRCASLATATGAVIDYQYDTLRRLTRSEVALNGSAIYTTAYAFRDLDASRTTTQVQYRNVRSANGTMIEGKKYTYDALGNITRISQSTKPFYTLVAYEYDAQNQLVKETYYNGNGTAAGNITRTISYTYDTAGNILSETRTEDGETTTKTYGYGDSDWADLLTEVDGQAITYDASGNPTSYNRGGTVETMTWKNGRQLASFSARVLSMNLRVTYTYDAGGIRNAKTVSKGRRGTYTYTFVTQNGKIVRQSWQNEAIDFFYDESGRPFAMTYQSANDAPQTYYYVLNLQGDVVKLVDASGAEAASYEYDAWGNVLLQSGSMAGVNPLRYRGYYRDSETGFYYLHSRYYDPTNHRFINADEIIDSDAGSLGLNIFLYGANNPINNSDPTGKSFIKDAIKWFAENIAKPVVKEVQKSLSKHHATYSSGINVSGSPSGVSFNAQIGISIDTQGNIAVQSGFAGGFTGGTPGMSVTAYQTVTNAQIIHDLNGPGYQIGGSVGVPVYGIPLVVGGDFNILPNSKNTNYYGVTTNVGFGTPGAEFHVEWGETQTCTTQFNIFDWMKTVYTEIMGW